MCFCAFALSFFLSADHSSWRIMVGLRLWSILCVHLLFFVVLLLLLLCVCVCCCLCLPFGRCSPVLSLFSCEGVCECVGLSRRLSPNNNHHNNKNQQQLSFAALPVFQSSATS